MVNLKSPRELQLEFDAVVIDEKDYHTDMQFSLDAYKNNVFHPQRPNAPRRKQSGVNLLQVFGDKLWYYVAPFPKISVPPAPGERDAAGMREKILLATHDHNQAEIRWAQQGFDGMFGSAFITFSEFDLRERCVKNYRIDPRRCWWRRNFGLNRSIDTAWFVEPMTKEQVKAEYNVEPTGEGMTNEQLVEMDVVTVGEEYFAVVTRVDRATVTKWVGDKLLVTPYNHFLGALPIDIDFPFPIADFSLRGDFYLRRLYTLQAEFNDYWRQRSNIVRKLGNPTVWGRGVKQKQFQPLKETMSLDGGFVGLAENGELGILSIPETKMIDTALADTFQRMKDLAGFPTATFGEVIGANTSGDALGMYFQPTTRMIDTVNTAYRNHLQSVNSKILKLYETFLMMGEPKTLYGYVPKGRYTQSPDGMSTGGGFTVQFTKDVIAGNYRNMVEMNPAAPKDEASYKELLVGAATQGLISKTTFFNEWGFASPEDELAMLTEENANPLLNPEGTAKIMGALPTSTAQEA